MYCFKLIYKNIIYCSVCRNGAGPPPNLISTNTTGKGSYSVPMGSYKVPPIILLSDKKGLQDNIVKSSNYIF